MNKKLIFSITSLLVSMTKQYGAQVLIYGQMTALGNEYRMTLYATAEVLMQLVSTSGNKMVLAAL